MNTKKLILSGLVALSLVAVSAQAVVLPGSDIGGTANSLPGDFVLGFRNAASNVDLVVDIGQFGIYKNATAGVTYEVGGFKVSELTSTFANAFTTAGTQWTVIGTTGVGNEISGTVDATLWSTSTGILTRQIEGVQKNLAIPVDSFLSTNLFTSTFGGASNANVLSSPKGFTNLGSATSYGGFFSAAVESTTEGSTSLNLFELVPGSGPGTLLGTFNLSSTGLTFTAFQAIPEPSTYATILGIATLGFAAIRRRKQAQQLV